MRARFSSWTGWVSPAFPLFLTATDLIPHLTMNMKTLSLLFFLSSACFLNAGEFSSDFKNTHDRVWLGEEYWANPGYGTESTVGTFFQWSWGDVDFFLLDDRYHRGLEDSILGDSIRRALTDLLPDMPLKARGHDEERHLFAQLLASAPEVTLSWQTVGDDGRSRAPSTWSRICVRVVPIGRPIRSPASP